MNLEEVMSAWNSPANKPSAAAAERLKAEFVRRLRKSHRKFVAFLVWAFGTLLFCTGLAVYTIFARPNLVLQEEWGALALLAIPWAFAIHFLLRFRRHRQGHGDYSESIGHALRAALDENRLACGRVKRIGLMYLIGIPVLALSIYQLRAAGKMADKEIISMLTVFGVALGSAATWMLYRYYRHLLPRRKEIQTLLRQYDQ